MQAVTYTRYGDPDVIQLDEVDEREPGPGEVRLDVRAAGVNPYDVHFMHGKPLFMRLIIGVRAPRWPRLGRDVAGVVESVGPEVTGFAVGDEVYGGAFGTFAQQAIAKAEEIAPKPRGLSWVDAASMPMAGYTALQGLRAAGCGPAQRVLVNGASGGIGHFAVQIAKAQGAEVTAVCKTENKGWVNALGADQVIDYAERSVIGTGPYDIVIDPVANHSLQAFYSILSDDGVYVWIGSAQMGGVLGPLGRVAAIGLRRGNQGIALNARCTREDMEELSRLVDAGALKPTIEHVFALSEAAAAMTHVATGHTKGKTVIVTD